MIKTKYWLSLLAVSVVLLTGSLAISPLAIADPAGPDDPEDPEDPELTECEECDRRLAELELENAEKHAKCLDDAAEETDADDKADKILECDDKYGIGGEEDDKAVEEWQECRQKHEC